jgi:hypothetical protein
MAMKAGRLVACIGLAWLFAALWGGCVYGDDPAGKSPTSSGVFAMRIAAQDATTDPAVLTAARSAKAPKAGELIKIDGKPVAVWVKVKPGVMPAGPTNIVHCTVGGAEEILLEISDNDLGDLDMAYTGVTFVDPGPRPAVDVVMNAGGQWKLSGLTTPNKGRSAAMVVNGEIVSITVIASPLSLSLVITNMSMTPADASSMASALMHVATGPIPPPAPTMRMSLISRVPWWMFGVGGGLLLIVVAVVAFLVFVLFRGRSG